MYKYIHWLFILFLVVVRKLLGLIMIWLVLPFRSYARNTVYSYHLENNIFLKRLWERRPKELNNGLWELTWSPHLTKASNKVIHTRKVTKIEYYIVLWLLWGWLDDDANEDTFDKGFNQTIIDGKRKTFIPSFIKERLKKANTAANNCPVVGNSFDLGDTRAEYPLFEFWSTFLWTNRNSAYNFNYRFHEINDQKLAWSIKLFGGLIGWREGTKVQGIQTYNFEIFYKEI